MRANPLLIANWKMNLPDGFERWGHQLSQIASTNLSDQQIVLCPPSTHITTMKSALPPEIALGGQDCSQFQKGAHTGDVSATMLHNLGCQFVILGHSERRNDHHETNAMVRDKALQARKVGLVPVICVGERLEDREAGKAEQVVCDQLEQSLPEDGLNSVVIAYEPIWAIGTGRTATPADANAMHSAIRQALPNDAQAQTPILYGGSVKPTNAAYLLAQPDIDGALVGGASLTAIEFAGIINAVA